jgi:hypothetical protein
MSRTFITGIAAAAALAVASLGSAAVTPAAAQSWSITIGGGGHHWRGHDGGHWRHRHGFDDRRHWRGDRGWHQSGWGHRGWGDHGWGYRTRPVYGFRHHDDFAPRCSVRHVRYWDGYGWTVEKRRFCR